MLSCWKRKHWLKVAIAENGMFSTVLFIKNKSKIRVFWAGFYNAKKKKMGRTHTELEFLLGKDLDYWILALYYLIREVGKFF